MFYRSNDGNVPSSHTINHYDILFGLPLGDILSGDILSSEICPLSTHAVEQCKRASINNIIQCSSGSAPRLNYNTREDIFAVTRNYDKYNMCLLRLVNYETCFLNVNMTFPDPYLSIRIIIMMLYRPFTAIAIH